MVLSCAVLSTYLVEEFLERDGVFKHRIPFLIVLLRIVDDELDVSPEQIRIDVATLVKTCPAHTTETQLSRLEKICIR